MALPKPGRLTLADGDEVVIDRVWYTTSPPGTYRVTFRKGGEPYGCKAWFRKGRWTEWIPGEAATEEDRQQARERSEDLF